MKPIPLPDPIKESQVKIRLSWKADRRTRKAILRQAQLMGSKDPTDYLCQLVACGLESNESMSVVLPNGELVCMSEGFKTAADQ